MSPTNCELFPLIGYIPLADGKLDIDCTTAEWIHNRIVAPSANILAIKRLLFLSSRFCTTYQHSNCDFVDIWILTSFVKIWILTSDLFIGIYVLILWYCGLLIFDTVIFV